MNYSSRKKDHFILIPLMLVLCFFCFSKGRLHSVLSAATTSGSFETITTYNAKCADTSTTTDYSVPLGWGTMDPNIVAHPLSKRIGNEIQNRGFLEIRNGEDGLEGGLNTDIFTILRQLINLQKSLVRSFLNFQQVGNLDGTENFRETYPLNILVS